MLKFPYGISNFQRLRTHGYLYLDRTMALSDLEQVGEQLLFLRFTAFGGFYGAAVF
ncbi:MAG: AAA family ATPase [Thiofilum sp.]|uniref:AAA family ATPase n=1 Tax=Thiofilum sp. TaxID=2212733 RepID=UPI0025D00B1F|nr:AAA family ATPase [Thiofilum sp.]MBK8453748.1 AAA family ATPase [Thiofilum sp.]